jgi:hypothetical protein
MVYLAKVNQSWEYDQMDTQQEQFENDKTTRGDVINVKGAL